MENQKNIRKAIYITKYTNNNILSKKEENIGETILKEIIEQNFLKRKGKIFQSVKVHSVPEQRATPTWY